MADGKCRKCHCAADSGACYSSCAAEIIANALNPRYGRGWKKSAIPEPARPSSPLAHLRLFIWPGLGVTPV